MIIFGLALLGAIFGSFVSALVWRLHEQAALAGRKGKAAVKRRKELSMVKGRSMCPHCGHVLSAKDLVPVFSWMWLRGKCRYCGAKIPDSPITELLMAVLFILSYIAWPYTMSGVGLFEFIVWLAFLVGFVALAVYDLRWFLLPNRVVFPLVALAVVQVVILAVWRHSLNNVWMPFMGAVVLSGLFWCLYQFSDGRWIGGGDVKLAIVLGLLAGTPFKALTVIFLASVAGTLASIPQLTRGKEGLTQRIPFGPSLLLATLIVVLWGTPVATWYQSLVLR